MNLHPLTVLNLQSSHLSCNRLSWALLSPDLLRFYFKSTTIFTPADHLFFLQQIFQSKVCFNPSVQGPASFRASLAQALVPCGHCQPIGATCPGLSRFDFFSREGYNDHPLLMCTHQFAPLSFNMLWVGFIRHI